MMLVAALLLAAGLGQDATALDWRERALLAVNEEAAQAESGEPEEFSGIDHRPLQTSPRGESVLVEARVLDPSRLFAPIVFARKSGKERYEAFTMRDRGRKGFQARLPASLLSEGSFEYFIEAQHDQGSASRLGSPRNPLKCSAYDPPPIPVPTTIRTAEVGALVRIDDREAGRTPLTVPLLPGKHTITVIAADGRATDRQIEISSRQRRMQVDVALPRSAQGPATLSVASEPPGANVFLDGTMLGRAPLETEVAPGEHTVACEMEGRLREDRRVVAREGRDASLSCSLAAAPKTPAVSIESDPVGAAVTLDGKERGRTPYVAPLAAGRHQLLLRVPGYREVAMDFAMPGDRDLSLHLNLPTGSGAGSRLTLTSEPPGATVKVDGSEQGVTPWSGEVKPGSHLVSLAVSGYAKEERLVQVFAGRDAEVSFSLSRERGPARIYVDTEPREAAVTIDGRQLGTSPLTAEVAPGDHQLEVALESYKTIAQELQVEQGQNLSLKFALQRAEARRSLPLIVVNTEPQGAQIFIDGKHVGSSPARIPAKPGRHEVRLELEGYVQGIGKAVLPESREFELRISVALRPLRGFQEKYHAPTNDELSRAQITAARACSLQGDYDCALKGYRAAFEHKQDPRLLFNIAQMRRNLSQYGEAASAYQAFFKLAGAKPLQLADAKIVSEARKQLSFCQQRLQEALKAAQPEPEDRQPPALAHGIVARAVRGQPLRLVARITDDRSGVGRAQACWRNLYRREFECHPLGAAGRDEYGIEVPASAVNDGFSYYVEAFDNDENGPARSGAPELPHPVVIDDPPRVPPEATALLENPRSRPTEGTDVTTGGSTRIGQPFGDRGIDIKLAPASSRGEWMLRALVGAERSREESYTDALFVGRVGLEAARWLSAGWLARGEFDWRTSRQQYVPFRTTSTDRVTVDENRFDLTGDLGYDVGALLVPDGRLELMPMLGAQYLTLRNTGFPSNLLGANVGVRARWSFPRFAAHVNGAYTYNLLSRSTDRSAFEGPVGNVSIRAGLALPLSTGYAIELDYSGDLLAFDRAWRTAHGAVFGISTSF